LSQSTARQLRPIVRVHLTSDQVVSVVAAASLAEPHCLGAAASVDLVDEPVDARAGLSGLGEVYDEQGFQRICRKQMSAPEEPRGSRQRVDRLRAAAIRAVMPKPTQRRTKPKDGRGWQSG
jgi:hypothetical protein